MTNRPVELPNPEVQHPNLLGPNTSIVDIVLLNFAFEFFPLPRGRRAIPARCCPVNRLFSFLNIPTILLGELRVFDELIELRGCISAPGDGVIDIFLVRWCITRQDEVRKSANLPAPVEIILEVDDPQPVYYKFPCKSLVIKLKAMPGSKESIKFLRNYLVPFTPGLIVTHCSFNVGDVIDRGGKIIVGLERSFYDGSPFEQIQVGPLTLAQVIQFRLVIGGKTINHFLDSGPIVSVLPV